MYLTRLVQAFNEGRIDHVLADVTDEYVYVDPSTGPLDSAAHRAQMEAVLASVPDRRIEIRRSAVGDGVEFGEGEWTGTMPTGAKMTMEAAVVVDMTGGKVSGLRWYSRPSM
jgi:ketosteroid isomerase-like protein